MINDTARATVPATICATTAANGPAEHTFAASAPAEHTFAANGPTTVPLAAPEIAPVALSATLPGITLMLLGDIAGTATDEEIAATLRRARLCQSTAERLDLPGDAAFLLGLLAGVAELTGQPTAALADRLRLPDEISDALVFGLGPLGRVLSVVRTFEAADADALKTPRPAGAELAKTYLAALQWPARARQRPADLAMIIQP